MSDKRRNWITKFQDAARGFGVACRQGKSFVVHFLFAAAVLICAAFFKVTQTEWCLLVLCIAGVLTAETINSSLESLAKSVTSEHDENVGHALDMAAGAVLIISIGSAAVGMVIFGP
jgi:diacylglycerol kinase